MTTVLAGARLGETEALKAAANADLGPVEFSAIAEIMQREARIHLTDARSRWSSRASAAGCGCMVPLRFVTTSGSSLPMPTSGPR